MLVSFRGLAPSKAIPRLVASYFALVLSGGDNNMFHYSVMTLRCVHSSFGSGLNDGLCDLMWPRILTLLPFAPTLFILL